MSEFFVHLSELFFGIPIRGAGYSVFWLLGREADPEGCAVAIVGIAIWGAAVALAITIAVLLDP